MLKTIYAVTSVCRNTSAGARVEARITQALKKRINGSKIDFSKSTTSVVKPQSIQVPTRFKHTVGNFGRSRSSFFPRSSIMMREEANPNEEIIKELEAKLAALRGEAKKLGLEFTETMDYLKKPKRVVVTGASGQIAYSLLFRIANGEMLGLDQPIDLRLLELPGAPLKALEGVVMELQDCAFPLLNSITIGDDVNKIFEGANYALLVGAKPRTKGMERKDLLQANAQVFKVQGQALNNHAANDVKVLVVGNPANTNALITSHYAPKIHPKITAMTRLDENRGIGLLAQKAGVRVNDVDQFVVWGNHSATQYPDISHAWIGTNTAKEVIDEKWYKEVFIPAVQQRGAAVIAARGASSAASAANAAIQHMRDWVLGTGDKWVSMAVPSDGSYGVDEGLWYSFPCTCNNGEYTIVPNLPIDTFSAEMMEATRKELIQEREAALK